MGANAVTNLPQGFTLDQPQSNGGLPPGFTLDAPSARGTLPKPTIWEEAGGAALRGLPGGPLGVITSMQALGLTKGMEALDKAAYGAGGAVTDIAAKTGLPSEVAGGLGYATNVATQALPTLLGGQVTKLVASPALRTGAEKLMQQAIKPTGEALLSGDAAKAITTMLEEGISATPAGMAKLQGQISKLNSEVAQAIASSPATVDKAWAASAIFKELQRFRNQVNPNSDVTAIKKAWAEFNNLVGSKISVQEAQSLKQGTYQRLRDKYGELGSADTAAQKAMARGLKESISDAVPEVAQLNAKESALINALEVSERRALMEGNKNMGGIAWLSHNPAVFAAFMADKSAKFKSTVARMMYSGSERIPQTTAMGSIAGYEIATQNKPQ